MSDRQVMGSDGAMNCAGYPGLRKAPRGRETEPGPGEGHEGNQCSRKGKWQCGQPTSRAPV